MRYTLSVTSFANKMFLKGDLIVNITAEKSDFNEIKIGRAHV